MILNSFEYFDIRKPDNFLNRFLCCPSYRVFFNLMMFLFETAPPGIEPGTITLTVCYSTAELWSNELFIQLLNYIKIENKCQHLFFRKI